MRRKVLKKSNRQRSEEGHKYSDSSDKKRKASAPGKRRSKSGKIYYEYRRDRTDVKGVDLPESSKRKTTVRKHTRKEGEINVKKHNRELQVKKASEGAKGSPLSLEQQLKKKDEQLLKGSRSEQFQDIGEKFYGAKKDYYSMNRVLEWSDILKLEENTADALQFITKVKIVMPIDEQAELNSGTTVGAIYLKKLAYQYLSNKPKINSKEARAFYFNESKSVFDTLSRIKTVDQFIDFQREYYRELWTRNIKKEYFTERLGSNFYAILTRTTQGSAQKVTIAKELENNKERIEKVEELLAKKKSEQRKQSRAYKKPYLETVERLGGKLIGTANPELIIKELGLRGVEYGNWVNDKEAQKNVKYFIGSMYDLGDMTGLDIIALNKAGKLGIAFGSRGSGGALAHFEPYRNVINLTKKKGDGSLAHEWGHYFDHLLKAQFGNKENNSGDSATYITNDLKNPKNRVQQAMKEVMDAIMIGNAVDEVEYEKPKEYKPSYSFEKEYEMAKANGQSDTVFFQKYVEKAKNQKESRIESYSKLKNIYNLSEKDIEKRTASEERKYKKYVNEIGKLIAYMKPEGKVTLGLLNGQSNYYVRSSKQGSGDKSAYWTKPHELFARAFEGFIQDKLKLTGRKNNYLANGTGSIEMSDKFANEKNFPYPAGEERKKINSAMERFLKVVNSKEANNPPLQKINAPTQQDTNRRNPNSYPSSFELRKLPMPYALNSPNIRYSLYTQNNGWGFSVFDVQKDKFLASGWVLHREQAEVDISKAIRGVY